MSRVVSALFLCGVAVFGDARCWAAANAALGVLTEASGAYLNEAPAYAGLSVFDGETLTTEPEGRLGLRVGACTIALPGGSRATLQAIRGGAHVDLAAGSILFLAPAGNTVEVHAREALLRPESGQATQAEIRILSSKAIQVSARRGNLEFSYHDEFQVIPEGQTYQIYLETPAEAQGAAGAGASHPARSHKVSYYIVGGAAAGGLAALGLHGRSASGNHPESPFKP